MKVALALRGHIRDGLTDSTLRKFIHKLSNSRNVELDIYCHTWSEHEAKSSYRDLNRSRVLNVTPDLIYHYFSSIEQRVDHLIKNVDVCNDENIKLNGNLEGVVCDSKIPRIAWKRMWAGQMQLVDTIMQSGIEYDRIVNTRYDMFTTPICKTADGILYRLFQDKSVLSFKYPSYTRISIGLDNFYAAVPSVMHALITDFHTDLDSIAQLYPKVQIHEQLVYEHARSKGYVR